MIRKNTPLLLLPVLSILSSLILASPSHAVTDLTGSYGFARMVAGFSGSTESVFLAGRGSITFNGGGSCTASLVDTEYGLNLPTGAIADNSGTQTLSCSYTLSTSGDLSLAFTGDTVFYQGSVSADGSSLSLAGRDSETSNKVMMLVGAKSGTGMSAASLKGSYGIARTVAGFPNGSEAMVLAGRGSISFNGSGSCSASVNETEYAVNLGSGAVASYPADSTALPCSYSVNSTGGVTLTFTGDTLSYQGNVSADGSSFTLAGPDSDTENKVMMLVGNRTGTGMSTASLKGSYGIARSVIGFAGTPTEAVVLAGKGAVTFDGSGGCQASLIDTEKALNLSTKTIADHSGAANLFCSYSVTGNGELTLTFAGDAISYQGSVSTDGSSFTLAGPDSATQKKVTVMVGDKLPGPYAGADLSGTWVGAGIKTPVRSTSDPSNFGYDVDRMTLYADGSGDNETLSSSDSSTPESFPAGSLTIAADGVMSSGDPNDFFYMNAGKDVMFQFRKDPAVGEQQLFVNVKQAQSYTSADLAGTWVGAGLKTPVKQTFDPNTFGYDVDRMVLNADGSGSNTTLSSSDSSDPETFPAGSITITGDGRISSGDPNDYFFMNAAKDVMFQFRIDPVGGEQQLFVNVKQAPSYSAADLAGIWYSAGINTPLKGSNNSGNFGYDVNNTEIYLDGGGFGNPISSSDDFAFPTAFLAHNFRFTPDGRITTFNPNEYLFMNASKDVMVQFVVDSMTGEQQLAVYLKQPVTSPVGFPAVDGACGTAHQTTVTSAPTANLCSSGSASLISGSAPWSWSCVGENGGSTASCSASPGTYNLSVTVAGTGFGTVHSIPGAIACSGSSSSQGCTASFPAGSAVQLVAAQSVNSVFAGWSGSASGTAGQVELAMTGDQAVTAIFNLVPKVKVGAKSFATLQSAYDDLDTVSGSVIQLLEGALGGTLTAHRDIAVKVEGGYNSAFSTRSATSTVQSPVVVRRGTVKMLGVKIKGL